jgi:hypothetical protein
MRQQFELQVKQMDLQHQANMSVLAREDKSALAEKENDADIEHKFTTFAGQVVDMISALNNRIDRIQQVQNGGS